MTVNSDTFALFATGVRLGVGSGPSADNRTVTLSPSLPADSVIMLVVTDDVEDRSCNRPAEFSTQFTTRASFDTGQPRVVSRRPGSGASGVSVDTRVVLYTDEPLNPATGPGALFASENGFVVDGTVSVTGGVSIQRRRLLFETLKHFLYLNFRRIHNM
jgi:hypothetical protein